MKRYMSQIMIISFLFKAQIPPFILKLKPFLYKSPNFAKEMLFSGLVFASL